MKKYLTSLIFVFEFADAWASPYTGTDNKIPEFDTDIVYVNFGAVVEPVGTNILVTYPATELHNFGTIVGPIDANDNNFFIYNQGVISGNIITNHGEIVTQIISSDADRTNFSINPANFRVEIDHAADINFDTIKTINASEFIISDSRIIINDFTDWREWDKNVDLQGPVCLVITNSDTVHNGDVVTHAVSGDTVNVEIVGLDGLHKAKLEYIGGAWTIINVRETDYSKIDNSVLEKIRDSHSGDKLLTALDSADSWEEIEHIKNLSYRFNHKILMRPVNAINNFSLLNMIKDETDTGAGLSTFYVFSDSVKNFGGRIYVGKKYENLYFNAGFTLNSFSYKDSLNDFSGLMYGLDIKSKQFVNNLWFREILGANLTKFHADYVTDKGDIKSNPLGFSWYGAFDAGYDFGVYKDITVAPIVGVVMQNSKVADVVDTDFYVRSGGVAKYSFAVDGLKYEYSLESTLGSNGNFATGIKIGFWSVVDEAGVSLDMDVFKDEFDWRYKIGLTGKISF